MRVLITGANGRLGRKLIDLLDRQDELQVMACARRPITFPIGRCEKAVVDVTDLDVLKNVVGRWRPDVIINAAAMTQVDQCELEQDECWKQNVTSVTNLVKTCIDNHVHLIHLSTDFVFNGKEGPLDESAVPDPINFYGKSKLEGEKIIQGSNCSAAILRTVLVYGATSDPSRSNIVLWVKRSLEEKKPIKVVNDQFRTPTLAEDLAIACLLAAQKKATGIYHVSGYEMMTPHDIAIKTADFFQLDQSLISPTDTSQFTQPAKRPQQIGFIVDKAKRELGYKPHSFAEGLKLMKEQLRSLSL